MTNPLKMTRGKCIQGLKLYNIDGVVSQEHFKLDTRFKLNSMLLTIRTVQRALLLIIPGVHILSRLSRLSKNRPIVFKQMASTHFM